jgi:DNA-binding transcriptional regulator YbjK
VGRTSQGNEDVDRRTALLDATIRLIASDGLGAVSHRGVERLAGAPHGSTTYYFQSKAALMVAARQRLADLDHLALDRLALDVARALAPRSDRPDLGVVAGTLARWVEGHRDLHVARFELALEATRHPGLAASDRAWNDTFLEIIEAVVTSVGSRSARQDARYVCAAFMGIVFEQVVRPQSDFAATVLPRALQRLLSSITRQR